MKKHFGIGFIICLFKNENFRLFGRFFKSGDIYKNDKIILHSDITKLFKDLKKKKFIFTLNDIADFFIEYIGVKGTLIIPTFNFNFCKGESYSIKETPSQMGVLSEVFRVKAKKIEVASCLLFCCIWKFT